MAKPAEDDRHCHFDVDCVAGPLTRSMDSKSGVGVWSAQRHGVFPTKGGWVLGRDQGVGATLPEVDFQPVGRPTRE